MARFMNKRELVLVVLLILVFDLNGFCDMTTNHIPYKEQFGWITYLLSIVFLLFDVYVFHFVITNEPSREVSLGVEKVASKDKKVEVEDKTKTITENADIIVKNEEIKDEELIKKEKEIESIAQDENLFNLAEKIVVNFIAAAVTCVIIFTIYFVAFSNKPGLNSSSKVAVLLIPLMLVVCSLLAFANIYLNYY